MDLINVQLLRTKKDISFIVIQTKVVKAVSVRYLKRLFLLNTDQRGEGEGGAYFNLSNMQVQKKKFDIAQDGTDLIPYFTTVCDEIKNILFSVKFWK